MVAVNDPVEQGFVSSLAHPGGNITGFALINFQMVGKWLEMLKEAAPGVSRAALMFNPDTASSYYVYLRSFEAEPRSIAVEVAGGPVPQDRRNRRGYCQTWTRAGRRPDRSAGRVHRSPSPIANQIGAAAPIAGRLRLSDICPARRVDVVWTRYLRRVSALSFLCRS